MGKTIRANGKERGPIGSKNNKLTRPDRHRKHKPYGYDGKNKMGGVEWKDWPYESSDPEEYGMMANVQNKHKARTDWKHKVEKELEDYE